MRATPDVAVRIGKYKLGRTLGIGSFGKVKLAVHELTGMKVAIKILDRNKIKSLDMDEKVKREIKILRKLQHPHIVRLFEVIETPTEIFLVLEYVSGGELFDYIVSRGRLHEDEARQFFQQVVSGVAFCHHHKVVHRDLKPENLLLSGDYNIKVADFGLSNVMLDGDFLQTSCGSPNYAAPEVIVGDLYAGPEVDVWSCGVILYALLCGSLPFDDESIPRLFRKIKSGVYVLPSHLSDGARDLIPKMLLVDPMQRITVSQIRKHPWFRQRLPPYLSIPPGAQQAIKVEEIDEEIVDRITAIDHALIHKLSRANIMAALKCDKKNTIRVTYDLLHEEKKNQERIEELRSTNEVEQRTLAAVAFSPPASPRSAPDARPGTGAMSSNSSSSANQRFSSSMNPSHRTGPHADNQFGSAPNTQNSFTATLAQRMRHGTAPTPPRGRRWFLGIQSKREPVNVMAEVFLALSQLRCQWQYKPSQPYRLICRWKPSRLNLPVQQDVQDEWVYLGLQLYKVQSSIFLLDFQRVGSISGSFQFMNLCSCIIHALALKQNRHSRRHRSSRHSSSSHSQHQQSASSSSGYRR